METGEVKNITAAVKSVADLAEYIVKANNMFEKDAQKSANKLATNLVAFSDSLVAIIDATVNMAQKIDPNKLQDVLIKFSSNPANLENINEQIDPKKQLGLLDLLMGITNMVSAATKVEFPRIDKIIYNTKVLMPMVISSIFAMMAQVEDFTIKNPKSTQESLKAFQELVGVYSSFIETLNNISGKTLVGMQLIDNTHMMSHIMVALIDGITGKDGIQIHLKGIKQTDLERVANIVTSISSIYEHVQGALASISKIVLLSIVIRPAMINMVMSVVRSLVINVNDLANIINNGNAIENAQIIRDYLDNIKQLCLTMGILALTSALVLVGAPVILLGLLVMKLVIGVVNWILQSITDHEKLIGNASRDLILISLAFLGFALSIILIGEAAMSGSTWEGFGMFVLMVAISVFVLALLNELKQDIAQGALAMLVVSLSFLLFAATLTILNQIIIGENAWETFGTFAAIVGLAVATLIGLWLVKTQVLEGAISLVAVAIAFILFTATLAILNALDLQGEIWKNMLAFAGIVALAVGVLFAVSFIAGQTTTGAIALIAIGGALIVVAIALAVASLIMQNVNWEALGVFGLSVTALIVAMAAIGFMMLSPIGAVTLTGIAMLTGLGVSLMIVAAGLQSAAVAANSLNVTGDELMEKIIDPYMSLIDKVIKIKWTKIPIALGKMIGLNVIALSLSNMAETLQDIALFRMPTKWDKDGKPIEFRQFTTEDFAAAGESTKAILNSMLGLAEIIGDADMDVSLKDIVKIGLIGTITGPLKDMLDVIQDLGNGQITTIVDGKEQKVNLIEFINAHSGDIKDSLEKTLTLFVGVLNDNDLQEKLSGIKVKGFDKLGEVMEPVVHIFELLDSVKEVDSTKPQSIIDNITKLAELGDLSIETKKLKSFSALDKVLNSYIGTINKVNEKKTETFVSESIKLFDKINTLDTSKLKSTTDLFREMANFSKTINGNFEKLAEVLSGDLLDAIKELNEQMTGLGNTSTTTQVQQAPVKLGTTTAQASQSQPVQKLDITNLEKAMGEIRSILEYFQNAGIKLKQDMF